MPARSVEPPRKAASNGLAGGGALWAAIATRSSAGAAVGVGAIAVAGGGGATGRGAVGRGAVERGGETPGPTENARFAGAGAVGGAPAF